MTAPRPSPRHRQCQRGSSVYWIDVSRIGGGNRLPPEEALRRELIRALNRFTERRPGVTFDAILAGIELLEGDVRAAILERNQDGAISNPSTDGGGA